MPDAFQFLWTPSRYKAVFGGRGSAKSHSIATALVTQAAQKPLRCLCCREIQNSIQDSVKQLLDDKIAACGLQGFFTSTKTEIVGANGSRFMFAGLRTNADSIKSMEGLDRAWVEEASRVSLRSWQLLIPTVRKEGSEIWASWNPESEYDHVDQMFRGKHVPPGAIVKRVSYLDNPFFPEVLRKEMEFDREVDAEKAAHVWDGDYQQAPKGAYYAGLLAAAQASGRIGRVPHEPGLEVYVSFDLGVGQQQSLWFSQRVGREIRLIDYLEGDDEAANEGYTWYARKMREGHRSKYQYANLVFPHDGRVREATGKSRAETMEALNFTVRVLPILPVEDGIEAVKRYLPMTWIDAEKCADGIKAVKNYREDWDEKLRRSNGPLKDWTAHAADSLRYTMVAYDTPADTAKPRRQIHAHAQGWMG